MIFFYIGLAFLTVHELDATMRNEWRILPILSSMGDQVASKVFIILHIPLFLWVFMNLAQSQVDASFRWGFDAFMVIHLILHVLLRKHPKNEFQNWMSWLIIVGAGVFGLLDMATIVAG